MKPNTLDQLYRTHMMDVYRYLRLLCRDDATAEDLVQETFYRAYIHLENYQEERVKPWLFKVAYNTFIDMKRKENRSVVRNSECFHGIAAPSVLRPDAEVLRKEVMEEVREWIATLPELQQQALLLYDMNHLSYQEAANIMGVTLSHFKILLFRARQGMRRSRERSDAYE
ncbi:sigma-70 family RNA polymerase sigma factor [Paenibacillus glacialis]|uniref:RNA polymerase subunit sigma-24 n=1 Tax=Paenibacillus glacialis TaxID=494026 RepID=A0A168P0X2_9BACL|nr:sigma-70 family RNA polymerase sigma factor [Paenibacillus glacialis]OAB46278.1 RNA polymerase subunit sigma-24 [Paenibacillus glacialis]